MEQVITFSLFAQELTSPRLIKSHLPYRFLPSALHNGEAKVRHFCVLFLEMHLHINANYNQTERLQHCQMRCFTSRWSTWPVIRRTWWCPTTSSTALSGPWATGEPSRSSAGASWTTNVSDPLSGFSVHFTSAPAVLSFSCLSVHLFRSGIWLLVRTRSGILGTPHGLKRPLLEIRRHVQGNQETFSLLFWAFASSSYLKLCSCYNLDRRQWISKLYWCW